METVSSFVSTDAASSNHDVGRSRAGLKSLFAIVDRDKFAAVNGKSKVAIEPEHPALVQQKSIRLDQINIAESPVVRSRQNTGHVTALRELIQSGRQPPEIVVFDRDGTLVLVDGRHRFEAYKLERNTEITAKIYRGTLRQEMECALKLNTSHGLPLSRKEKLAAVQKMLGDEIWRAWTDTTIAKYCGLSSRHVGRIRQLVSGEQSATRKFDAKNGKTRTIETSALGRKANQQKVAFAKKLDACIHKTLWQSKTPDAATISSAVGSLPLGAEQAADLAGRLRLIADTLVQSARKQTPKATQVA